MDDFEGEGDTFIDASGIPRKRPYAKRFDKPDSDEEIGDVTKIYNVQEAWRSLLSLPTCQKVMVT